VFLSQVFNKNSFIDFKTNGFQVQENIGLAFDQPTRGCYFEFG